MIAGKDARQLEMVMASKRAMTILRELQIVKAAAINEDQRAAMTATLQAELDLELWKPGWVRVSQPGGVPPDPQTLDKGKK
ncbi:MAG: hypothetical protein [Microvirus sp.]|nr:MAG: hypothetical protein [Microvirus sp.]